jgi:hypothetical protein
MARRGIDGSSTKRERERRRRRHRGGELAQAPVTYL